MALTYGVAALARPTFDVSFAESEAARAFEALESAGIRTIGPRELLFDADAAEAALAEIETREIDLLLILQVTFTDASMTVRMAERSPAPVALWGLPEPRLGGRLRLNALCGINLAVHALGLAEKPYGWLYAAPDRDGLESDLRALVDRVGIAPSRAGPPPAVHNPPAARRVIKALGESRFGIIGTHPEGFHTCGYDPETVAELIGAKVETISLDTLFQKARAADRRRVAAHRQRQARQLAGLDEVAQQELDRSLRLLCGLEDLQAETGTRGMAVRCWPETFTEYGCAACGPMGIMNEAKVPCACEADMHGLISAYMLQEIAGEPAWMADLVDLDVENDTGVLWHCGLAPYSMRDPEVEATATVHTNRQKPLLQQFPLKPGRITIARLSRARNEQKLMIGAAEVLRAPMAFTGTSGVVRFDSSAREVCSTIMEQGLEHHYALAYGDHRDTLQSVASELGLPVLELT